MSAIATREGHQSRRKLALVVAAVAAVAVFAVLAVLLTRWMASATDYDDDAGVVVHHRLGASQIDPSWIISGSPKFRLTVFDNATHQDTFSGIWECTGPGKFKWEYGVDEVIYILDGSAQIEYLGKTLALGPGDSIKFVSGTTALWTVSDHVRKTFTIHGAGRTIRGLRKFM